MWAEFWAKSEKISCCSNYSKNCAHWSALVLDHGLLFKKDLDLQFWFPIIDTFWHIQLVQKVSGNSKLIFKLVPYLVPMWLISATKWFKMPEIAKFIFRAETKEVHVRSDTNLFSWNTIIFNGHHGEEWNKGRCSLKKTILCHYFILHPCCS